MESTPIFVGAHKGHQYWGRLNESVQGHAVYDLYRDDDQIGRTKSLEELTTLMRCDIKIADLSEKNVKKSCKQTNRVLDWCRFENYSSRKEPVMATAVVRKPAVAKKPVAPAAPAAPAAEATPAAPPKARVALTEDELQALVNGELQPRENVGDASQESLGMTDANGRPKGRPIGVTTGLPITAAWSYIFQFNEKQPTNDKWTDEQISAWMKAEFPGRNTPAFDHPAGCRADYNAGKFSKGVAPSLQSHQYSADGQIIEPRRRGVAANGDTAEPTEPAPAPAKPAAVVRKPAPAAVKPAAPAAKPAPAKAVVRKPAAVKA